MIFPTVGKMIKIKILLGTLFITVHAAAQETNPLFKTQDFTKENIFSENIEGPAFDKHGNLFVVNYQKNGTVALVKPNGDVSLFLTLPEGSTANSIQFDQNGTMYLADFTGHNVLKVNMQTKEVGVHVHNDTFNQPNDLCINQKGQLFASDPNWKTSSGKLWRIDPTGVAVLLTEDMGTTNGIELSPDEKILYVNESVQRKIWAFDVDATGNISNKRMFAEFTDFGLDGMKCDNQGNLYITRHEKGVILILSPQGKFIREIPLTGKKCSNLVFGGKDGKTIFVTLQDRKGMEKFLNDIPGKKH